MRRVAKPVSAQAALAMLWRALTCALAAPSELVARVPRGAALGAAERAALVDAFGLAAAAARFVDGVLAVDEFDAETGRGTLPHDAAARALLDALAGHAASPSPGGAAAPGEGGALAACVEAARLARHDATAHACVSLAATLATREMGVLAECATPSAWAVWRVLLASAAHPERAVASLTLDLSLIHI